MSDAARWPPGGPPSLRRGGPSRVAGKKLPREQRDWGLRSRRRRRVRPEFRKVATRSLILSMALVLVARALLIAAARES